MEQTTQKGTLLFQLMIRPKLHHPIVDDLRMVPNMILNTTTPYLELRSQGIPFVELDFLSDDHDSIVWPLRPARAQGRARQITSKLASGLVPTSVVFLVTFALHWLTRNGRLTRFGRPGNDIRS